MKRLFLCIIFLSVCQFSFSQSIEKKWNFQSIEKNGETIFDIDSTDVFHLSNGKFKYSLVAKDSLIAEGVYKIEENKLTFNYTSPKDTTRVYEIAKLDESNLIFTENQVTYSFQNSETNLETDVPLVIPSQGFSLTSLWRGVIGMIALLFIAFLFSSNRKGIDWKTVGIGLTAQLIIAIGVLKIPFVQAVFDFIGKGFVQILEFTQQGSEFLFKGLISDMDTFGFIFAFQVLPTIVFFSALTSLLFI